MTNIMSLFETYLMVLVHPFRIHQQFRHQVAMPHHDGHIYAPLSLAEALGMSWVFAMIRGIAKLLILNFFFQSFLAMQSENFPFIEELMESSGYSTYYLILFSAALDIIFFPIAALVMTEVWGFFIRLFCGWLNPELPKEDVADQITTHALSSNVFSMVPFIGDIIQPLLYYFLLYAGLRSNLGASRSLAYVIIVTPTLIGFMFISLVLLAIFYLIG